VQHPRDQHDMHQRCVHRRCRRGLLLHQRVHGGGHAVLECRRDADVQGSIQRLHGVGHDASMRSQSDVHRHGRDGSVHM
jgi:hypothetical protein